MQVRHVMAWRGDDRQHDPVRGDVLRAGVSQLERPGQPLGFLDGATARLVGDHDADIVVVAQTHGDALVEVLEDSRPTSCFGLSRHAASWSQTTTAERISQSIAASSIRVRSVVTNSPPALARKLFLAGFHLISSPGGRPSWARIAARSAP